MLLHSRIFSRPSLSAAIAAAVLFLSLSGCTVLKRHYRGGFYIAGRPSVKPPRNDGGEVVEAKAEKQQRKDEQFASVASALTTSAGKLAEVLFSPPDSCDVLLMTDGNEIRCRISEIGDQSISYKRCDLPKGPVYVVKKSQVFMAKFVNGTRQVFSVQETAPVDRATFRSPGAPIRTHPAAMGSLISGLLAVIAPFLAGAAGPWLAAIVIVLSIVLAITAVVLGRTAIRAINSHPDQFSGKALAIVGSVLGWLILFVALLFVVALGFVIYALTH